MSVITSDKIWKLSIENYFQEFMKFFAPDISQDIDFSKGFESLSKELEEITLESEGKDRRCDELIKITLNNNQEQWVYCYCHLEVQGYRDENFSERMYEYFYRIKDKFHQKVYPLAIYTHDCVDNQPSHYEEKFYGMSLRYEYPTYKVTDPDEAWLKVQDNAFAIAVLACQYALKSKSDLPLRVNFKRELMDILYQKKWERAKILQFFSYLNVLIRIPSEKENRKAVEGFIEKMSKQGVDDVELKWYTTLVEDAKEEASEKAGQQKALEIAKNMLKNGISIELVERTTALPKEKIMELAQSR